MTPRLIVDTARPRALAERLPPQDIEAEQATLGAILFGGRTTLEKAQEHIACPDDFYREAHGFIWEAFISLALRREPFDIITLRDELRAKGCFDEIGGASYLMALADVLPTAANVAHYARIVGEKALLRQSIEAAAELAGRSYLPDADPQEVALAWAETAAQISARADGGKAAGEDTLPSDAVMEAADWIFDPPRGITTGISDLDWLFSLRPGEMTLLGGRRGGGKSALAQQIMLRALLSNLEVVYATYEMSRPQVVSRMIYQMAQVDSRVAERRGLDTREREALAGAMRKLAALPFTVLDGSDGPTLTPARLLSACRRRQLKKKLKLLFVDYLQIVPSDPPPNQKRYGTREEEVKMVGRGLREIAKRLRIPVLAISQLNQDGDARESRSLEMDADNVLVMEASEERAAGRPQAHTLTITKQRYGPEGSVDLSFLAETVTFRGVDKRRGEA